MKYTAVTILAMLNSMASAQSIFDPIIEAGEYSQLLAAVEATGNVATLEANAPVTIFGPKDSAFDAIADTLETLTPEQISGILLNHVIVGAAVTSDTVIAEGCIEATTAGGLQIGILFDPATSTVTANGVTVSEFDIAGDYGVLHGIDEVLLGEFVPCPPKAPAILNPIVENGNYNILLEAIVGTGLVDDLAGILPVTIFGPKDAAFQAIQSQVAGMEPAQVKEILLNHVIAGAAVTSTAVVEAGCLEATTVGGLKLGILFDPETSTVTVNGVTVSDFDVSGDYGVLHGIDQVLLGEFVPCPAFEADFTPIAEKGIYNTLLGALVQTGGDAAISASAPVTIFGPKDEVFAGIQETLDTLSTDELLEILKGHVVVGVAVDSNTVATLKCVEGPTAAGSMIAVRYNETTNVVDVNGVVVDDFDIQGNFGIMHGINGVISPDGYVPCPIPSFVEQVAMIGNFNTLLQLIDNPVLQSQLESIGPITVFGPSDEAFAAVESDLEGLSATQLQLALGGHVVQGVYTSADVKAAGCVILDTVVGTKIRAMWVEGDHDDHSHRNLRRLAAHMAMEEPEHMDDHDHDHMGGYIMINEAEVIVADIADETSIFHGLDTVLLSTEPFVCPTAAPVAAPTAAPADESKKESSAPFASFSAILAAVVAIAAIAF